MRKYLLAALAACMLCGHADARLPPESARAVSDIVRGVLQQGGTPSASVSIAMDGKVAFAEAYGQARLAPEVAAKPAARYKIGSISKQFTAAAVLLLQEDGRLSVDDPVSKYFPALTRASEITIRQLLTHTSGYQDYYPLDYVAPFMQRDVDPADILKGWAAIPLDFEPGTQWQYSNTNYVLAGLIVSRVAKMPLSKFLQQRILGPLGMHSAIDVEEQSLGDEDPRGYEFHALGPPREARTEGRGWVYATGELAMTAEDVAKWNVALMKGAVLKPLSMRELTTEQLLQGGIGARYAMGLSLKALGGGHRRWSHSGASQGFLCWNAIYPDDGISITVLTNSTRREPMQAIAQQIEELLLGRTTDPGAAEALENTKRLLRSLAAGKPDRSLLSADLQSYFTDQAVADFQASLQKMGPPESVRQIERSDRGGMVARLFQMTNAGKTVNINTFMLPDGTFSQFLITPAPE